MELGAVLAEKVLDKLLGGVLERLSGDAVALEARLAAIEAGIQSILERQTVVPVRAALSFLELGHSDRALEELVRAEASDPLAPLPKLLLAALLHAQGRPDLARSRLAEALEIQPFLCDAWNANRLPSDPTPAAPARVSDTPRWRRQVVSGRLVDPACKDTAALIRYAPAGNVTAISTGARAYTGSGPLLAAIADDPWLEVASTRDGAEHRTSAAAPALVGIDGDTAAILWEHDTGSAVRHGLEVRNGVRPLAVTPRLVALEREDGGVQLIAPQTGKSSRTITSEYWDALFSPVALLGEPASLWASHRSLADGDAIAARLHARAEPGGGGGHDATAASEVERAEVSDPWCDSPARFRVTQTWRYSIRPRDPVRRAVLDERPSTLRAERSVLERLA